MLTTSAHSLTGKTLCACLCFLPLTVALVAAAVATAAEDGTHLPQRKVCVYEGRVMSAGHRFKADQCTTCRCPRKGGQVVCTVVDCLEERNCLRYSNVTSCCQRCVEYGCPHTDGHVYKRGEMISQDGCSRCYCPLKGGMSTCDVKPCPPIMCVDFVPRPGKCCPRCPRGANCQLGMRTIPRGAVVTSADGNSLCRCRMKRRGRNLKLEAVCVNKRKKRG